MRILIVEDESVAARGLEKLLREIYGKEIEVALRKTTNKGL
jgi:DNA-binding LytR/AlgR family response regulator